MICPICRQTEIVDRRTRVIFARDEFQLVVKNVPARICPSCDEAYVGEDVVVKLLQDADKMSKAGILENVIEYKDNGL
jgi:YgiT-type zinc finger domain-containing protein